MEPIDINLFPDLDLSIIPATALSLSTRRLLSILLNPQQNILSRGGYYKDFRGLAQQMNFTPGAVKYFGRNGDPTYELLKAWSLFPDTSFGKLLKYLIIMDRHDIIVRIEEIFEDDVKTYMVKRPLQIAEVTSCLPPVSSLEGNVTHDDASTGEIVTHDVYVAYAAEDSDFVYRITKYLEASGLKPFKTSEAIHAGHDEDETNMQLVKSRCKRILIVLSPAFLDSPAREVQESFVINLRFNEMRQKVLLILWKPCDVPLILTSVLRLDFTNNGVEDLTFDQLNSSLQNVTSSTFKSANERIAPELTIVPQIEPDSSSPAI